jgi:phosphoribosylaminoimidazole-succinocarboxamide synthase
MTRNELRRRLGGTINETSLDPLGAPRRGKVRDIYDRGSELFFVTTDRVSAFDRVITTIPFKGFVLTSTAAFWFERTRDIARNHLLDVPHPNVMRVRKLRPLDVEMVVRAYITGVTSTSLWTHYSAGRRVIAGHALPEGLRKNERLQEPLITPSTKAAVGLHDETVSPADLIRAGVVTEETYEELARVSLGLFAFGTAWCAERGVILVDTKYEFGLDEEGKVTLMDEIHTPDSSRFWDAASYEDALRSGEDPMGFDKEYVRRWLKGAGFGGDGKVPDVPDEVRAEAGMRYIEAYEKITGRRFEPPYVDARVSLAEWAAGNT